jgi:hypothetical protein
VALERKLTDCQESEDPKAAAILAKFPEKKRKSVRQMYPEELQRFHELLRRKGESLLLKGRIYEQIGDRLTSRIRTRKSVPASYLAASATRSIRCQRNGAWTIVAACTVGSRARIFDFAFR